MIGRGRCRMESGDSSCNLLLQDIRLDSLPVHLASVIRRAFPVRALVATRLTSAPVGRTAGTRRGPLQVKVDAGLSPQMPLQA